MQKSWLATSSNFWNCEHLINIFFKGAPEVLIKKCQWLVKKDGSRTQLDSLALEHLTNMQNDWSSIGQRVLLVCKKIERFSKMSSKFTGLISSDFESYLNELNDMCVLGMVGILDKQRDGIKDVINSCRQAGVRFFMVTGDYHLTATNLANQIGIFSSKNKYDTVKTILETKIGVNEASNVVKERKPKTFLSSFCRNVTAPYTPNRIYRSLLLSGSDLEQLDDTSYWNIITKYEEIVFARTTPSQKLKVVEEFKKRRNIVAVTGDGVNDSPALKAANIGIAMGGGSEVAIEAAQVVLLDNSFDSILIAIENGRLVFENLRKVVLFLLPAGSFADLIPILLNIYLGMPLPLSAFQMIFISCLTDVAPSLAMMLEKSEGNIMYKMPRVVGRDHLVDWRLLLYAYFFLGIFESTLSIFMFFFYLNMYGGLKPSQVFFAYDKWNTSCVLSNTTIGNATLTYSCYYGYNGTDLKILQNVGQTVTFVTLVILQTFGNVFITRTHRLSLFQSFPLFKEYRNWWLFVAQFISVILMLFVIYVPWCNSVFDTAPIPIVFYFIPLCFCVCFITLDEIRKLILRQTKF